jgi:hypothetical protein
MTATAHGFEPLFRTADLMPLGRRLGMIDPNDDVPGAPSVRLVCDRSGWGSPPRRLSR